MEKTIFTHSSKGKCWLSLLPILLFLFAGLNVEGQVYSHTESNPYITKLDVEGMKSWLKNSPVENTPEASSKFILVELPLPGGGTTMVRAIESSNFEPDLAAQFPEIKTYAVQGVDDPTITGRISISPRGLDGLYLTQNGDIFIEPTAIGSENHKVYFVEPGNFPHGNDVIEKEGFTHQHSPDEPEHHHDGERGEDLAEFMMAYNIGAQVRIYRMHVIADGEYSQAVGGGMSATRATVTAGINAALTGMNALYMRDFSMKLSLTANTTIYLNPAANPAGFAPNNGANDPSWINESLVHHKFMETNTTSDGGGGTNPTVDRTSYDVGHMFSGRTGMNSGGGGVAFRGVVCLNSEQSGGPIKAGGGSAITNPQGSQWVNLLAHEFTHQFNAAHTWNGFDGNCTEGQFGTGAAYEPGGGSTIVSYDKICATHTIPNLGNLDYYHTISIKEVNDWIAGQGNCNTTTASGNVPPVPSTSTIGCTGNYNIPTQTPFEITGSATDANDPASQLTYTWEQFDLGTRSSPIEAPLTNSTTLPPATNAPNPASPPIGYNGEPLFRSYFPSSSPMRTFPSLSIITSGKYNGDQTAAALGLGNWQGELLSEVARTITLRLTVRDNNANGGGVEFQDVSINVVNTGAPFKVTAPNGGETLTAGNATTVNWNVAGTTAAPISCANVTIKLSVDGGLTYPISLGSFPNNGTASVTIPSTVPNTTTARLRVECGTDCFKFFDISNANFTITSNCTATSSNICPTEAMTVAMGPAANLSLENHYGGAVTNHTFNITNASPTGPLANATMSGGNMCQTPFGTEKYEMFDFVPSATGSYTFTKDAPFAVFSVFVAAGYNPAMPCSGTFIGSNSTGAITASSSATFNLTACTKYKLVVWSANGANITSVISFSGAGSILESNTAPVNTGYTYVAVNTANNQIAAQSASSDFSSLAGGTYKIYGANYKNGGTTPPNNSNPASWVGQTLSAVQSSDCVLFSTNCKTLTITSTACSITNLTSTSVMCNGNNVDIAVSFTVANGGGSYNVVNTGTNTTIGTISGSANGIVTGTVSLTGPTTMGSINIKIVDAGTNTCESSPISVNIPTCPAPMCSLTDAGLASVMCNDGGTQGGNASDDYITFSLNPTGSNLGTMYNVTVSSGTVTPTSASYSSATNFQLQAGSAGAGNVTVTITDASNSGCTITAMITDPGACSGSSCDIMITNVANTPETCSGANDGTITVTATGTGTIEYSIDGTNFQTSNTFSGLAPNTYTVTARIQGSSPVCSATQMTTVSAGQAVAITNVAKTDEGCPGANDGTITVTATGPGTLEYSIDGTNFQTSNAFTGLAPNNYTVTVRVQGTAACSATSMTTIAAGSDTTKPTIAGCPSNITQSNDAGQCGAAVTWTAPTAMDNCPGVMLSSTHNSGDNFPVGTTTVTYTATDASGNTETCSFDVTINDTEKPTIAGCPSNITQSNDAGQCGAAVTWTAPTANDNCPNVSLSSTHNPGDNFPVGTTTVTYTATDASGNTETCSFDVTVNDSEPPVAVCQDLSVNLDGNGNKTLSPNEVDNGSSDNCPTLDLSLSQTAYDCSNVGINTVSLTATDGVGLTNSCDATVGVIASLACTPPNFTNAGGPNIADPCSCRGNGEFDEEVVVGPTGPGQQWAVSSTTLIDPNTGLAYPAGTLLTEVPQGGGQSIYVLQGIHLDGIGYTITVSSPFWPGQSLSTNNTCFYPEPVITTDLTGPFCLFTPVFPLDGIEANGAEGAGSFTINGVAATEFDANALGIGTHTVEFSWNAGNPAGALNPPNVGCVETVLVFVNVIETPDQIACNDLVHVSLDENCEALITPDMVLEGTYGCFDDYEVHLSDEIGAIIANPVTGVNIGQTVIAKVEHLISGVTCWGTLSIEDKLPPVVICDPVTLSCTDDFAPAWPNGHPLYPGGDAPLPLAFDNCFDVDIQLTDEQIDTDNECNDATPGDGIAGYVTITRTWVSIDENGLTSTPCTQVITINRPDEVDFPDDIIWTCDNYNAYPNITDATPLHPFITDSDADPLFIDVFLDETCDDDDRNPNPDCTFLNLNDDDPTINSTNTTNGGLGCFGESSCLTGTNGGLDDADVLELTGSGIPTDVDGIYCNYQYSAADATLNSCGSTFKIIRTWTVLDWCTGLVVTGNSNGEDNVQVIKILDNKAPEISRDDFTVGANVKGTHPQNCASTELLLAPTFSDNCSDVTVRIYTPIGEAIYVSGGNGKNGGLIPSPGLELGVHTVTYVAEDACGNVTEIDVQVTVEDQLAPSVICDEITDVNLSSDGLAVVSASTFDDGTFDNCCLDRLEVARMEAGCNTGTSFGANVTFCCDDVTQNPIAVILRAVDCAGNTNECMVDVHVQDKLPPILVSCPGPQDITCDFYWEELEVGLSLGDNSVLDQFGTATFIDNCNLTITPNINVSVDQCGNGTITRTWQASDDAGNGPATCTQIIRVHHVSDWVVEFPADLDADCGNDAPDFGEPELFFETCELLAVSYEDTYFDVVPDACYKIARQWTVINWCVVGDVVDQEVVEVPESQMPFAYRDLDKDGINFETRVFRDSWNGTNFPGATEALTGLNLPPDTDIDLDPWDGFITYEQVIKVTDNVSPEFADGCDIPDVCIEDNTCSAKVDIPLPNVQDCSDDVTVTFTHNMGNSLNTVAPGTYTVTYTAMDNCGNSNACQTTVTVLDCKKPTPYCKNGLVIELMQTGMIDIWASDFDAGSFDNCPGDVAISFSTDVNDTQRIYDCDHVGQQNVEIWVTDAAGNQDFCNTFVIIEDNMNACDPVNPLVAGTTATEADAGVEDVNVTINSPSGFNSSVMTDADGNFSFANVPAGGDYTITPEKDVDPLNGVSTYDLVLMSKHILNVQLLDSPYKMIAADVNNSGTITTFDLVAARKLILFISDEFPNNTSWRFVRKDHQFSNPANPFADNLPEVYNLNNLPSDMLNTDFVAIKVGDVNGNANPNSLVNADDRNFNGNLTFVAENTTLKAGEAHTVSFTANDFNVIGYQFTLNFNNNALELVDVLSGLAQAENFGLALVDEGVITTSWNSNEAITLSNNETVFSIVVTAKEDIQLSDAISINSRYTAAEAYNEAGELKDISLEFTGSTVARTFELMQNTPNPFSDETVIGFTLPEASSATLSISDASGKVIRVVEGDFGRGYNQVTINRSDLVSTGVLYYQLDTPTNTAVKKMILISTK